MPLSNYDKRQLGRMLTALNQYDEGVVPIDALISSLDGLISALETEDSGFKAHLHKHWGALEIAYGSALDKGRIPFEGPDRKSIEPALDELRRVASTHGISEEE
jgi:hypothetical protein